MPYRLTFALLISLPALAVQASGHGNDAAAAPRYGDGAYEIGRDVLYRAPRFEVADDNVHRDLLYEAPYGHDRRKPYDAHRDILYRAPHWG